MEVVMNKDTIEGNWEEIKGKAKQKWGKLTDNDLMLLKGNRQEFLGRVQEAYGKSRSDSERDLQEFEKSCGCTISSKAA
jgi:uncharacterized protein YjbJ (UPF0337 family)